MTLDTLRDIMPALVAGNPGYDAAATSYHVLGTPVAVLQPLDADGVAAAVRWAVAEGHPVSVRGGGHTVWGTNAGGVVIHLGSLDGVAVDDDGLVRVGGGAVWGDVTETLLGHGLAISSGDTASVGVGGLTLGGGIGWLVRAQGLALDHLVQAEIVTAAGDILRVDATHEPELFWALRGGGGNFGVVTEFVFRPAPLDGIVTGDLVFDRERLPEVLRAWRDTLVEAPDPWTSTLYSMPGFGPEMPASLRVVVAWAGTDVEAARAASRRLLEHPALLDGGLEPGEYTDLLDGPPPEQEGPAPTVVEESELLVDLSDTVLERIAAAHADLAPAVLMIRSLGGAYGRIADDATAFPFRSAAAFAISAAFRAPDADPATVSAARERWEGAVGGASAGTYGNFRIVTSPEIVASMYPPATRERLLAVKRAWDPANVFAANHNIDPA